jgi:serine/threonine-protein kinase
MECKPEMTERNESMVDEQDPATRISGEPLASPIGLGDPLGPSSSSTIPPGTLLINTYRVQRLLASGGMGEVYLAQHVGLGTWHAIKVIRPELFSNQQVLDLFRREATVLRGVRHDAIVSYDGSFRDEKGRDYLVMEYVEGPSLQDRLKQGPLSLDDTIVLRDRLTTGLAEAHRKGAVHRDISPDNVVLPEGRLEHAKLIDFGLCKLTDPTQETIVGSDFAGKYRFASPEQLGLVGGQVDARSDIYSLGLVLAAAVLGRPLDMGSSFEAVIRAREAVPPLTEVPEALRGQLSAMLQPNPADRPQTLAELIRHWPTPRRAADARAPGRSGAAARAAVGAGGGKGRQSRRWLGVAGAVVALVMLGVGGYWFYGELKLPDELHKTPAGTEEPTVARTLDELVQMPWADTAPYFRDWLARGRMDDAFALLRGKVAQGQSLPPEDTYRFAQDLLARGRLDDAFALLNVLAGDGHGAAALALGEMYDPVLWSPVSSPFSSANPRKAEDWYRSAMERGAEGAGARLEALERWKTEQGAVGDDAGTR